jgi:hypothetical protein
LKEKLQYYRAINISALLRLLLSLGRRNTNNKNRFHL